MHLRVLCCFRSGAQQLKIRVGEWDASASTEPLAAQEFFVSRIFVHPLFTSANLKNDIALIRLSSPVPLGQLPTIGTVCLPSNQVSNARCWVAGKRQTFRCNNLFQTFKNFNISGWGRNDFLSTGAYQSIMREVDVPLVDQSVCQTQLRATRLANNFALDTTSFICAGGENGKGDCMKLLFEHV